PTGCFHGSGPRGGEGQTGEAGEADRGGDREIYPHASAMNRGAFSKTKETAAMSNGLTRRGFLATAAVTAGGFLIPGERAAAQPGSVRVRRSVFSPTAPLADYRTGVGVMKSRPLTDPTSWLYQANMHGTTAPPPAGALWNQCQHGSFFFLSWHRMYLYYFERIVRKACGNNA